MIDQLGDGNPSAPVWIIGRDWGEHEARARKPFQNARGAGGILNKALQAASFDIRTDGGQRLPPTDCYLDNLVPTRPAGNNWDAHDEATKAWGFKRLRALVRAHQPKLIVTLGNEAAEWFLGDQWPRTKRGTPEGIRECRGYLWDTRYGRVLTTMHPAAFLREWTPWRALFDLDLRKAQAEVRLGCPPLPEREVTIVTSPTDLAELDAAIAAGGLGGGGGAAMPWMAVDIENHEDLTLACCGFAPSPERAWVVPARSDWQRAAIQRLCESDVPKVLQNGQYDTFFLDWFCGITLRNQVADTMLQWHVLQPELAGKKLTGGNRRTAKSLKFLVSVFLRDGWYKNYDFASAHERFALCGKDCCATWAIAAELQRQVEAK